VKDLRLVSTMTHSSLTVRSGVGRISNVVSASAWVLLIAFFAIAGGMRQVQAQDGAQLLRVSPAVGQEFVWTAVMKTEAVSAVGEFQLDMNLTQQVLARTEQDVTWSMKTAVTQVVAKGVFAGIETALRAVDGIEMTKVVNRMGQTTRLTMDGQNVPSSGTPDVTFPEKAVTPGESWVASVDAGGGRKANIRYTFKGRSTADGMASLLIEGVYEPEQMVKSIEPTIFHLDPTDCTPISASGVMEANLDGGKILRSHFSVKRSSTSAKPLPKQ
jgi:hypothetical protein